MANIIIFFIISLSFFDNLCFVGSFDNILVFFPLIIIYGSLVPLIIYGSLFFFIMIWLPSRSSHLPYTTLVRSTIVIMLPHNVSILRRNKEKNANLALFVSLMGTSSKWQTS